MSWSIGNDWVQQRGRQEGEDGRKREVGERDQERRDRGGRREDGR